MKIAANNLKRQYDLHADEYEAKALEVLRSGWYILGPEVKAFEQEFASYIGTKYCVGLANGLDALILAFRILNIGEGDEVIVCGNAYIACVMGVSINGALPVLVEPDEYANLDADRIEEKITDKTKAILAVHLYGQSCDMTKICALEDRKAFATAISIILPLCMVSLFVYQRQGDLDLSGALPYLAGGLLGGTLGGKLYQKIQVIWLHRLLGLLILYGGGRMLLG